MDVGSKLDEARTAARSLRRVAGAVRSRAVHAMADAVAQDEDAVLAANEQDMEAGKELRSSLRDRLHLGAERLETLVELMHAVADLPDPLASNHPIQRTASGLRVSKRRIPLGVIGVVYEARPNVTAETAALAVKSGNAVVLRGGKEARATNQALGAALTRGLGASGLDTNAVQVWADVPRESVVLLLRAAGQVDLLIPRGGPNLMALVDEEARVPVVRHGEGVVHMYIDEHADAEMAVRLAYDAKVDRPGVCNALETLLIHRARLPILDGLGPRLKGAGVELRADPRSAQVLAAAQVPHVSATHTDWATEFLDLRLAIRTVDNLEAALDHIEAFGTHHTAAIVSSDAGNAERFLSEIDASCVLWNASTRFNDGPQLGLGAELGISTSKMHAYGPMDLNSLTSEKFVVFGDGHTRGPPVA